MSTWYRTGTIALTNGNATVTGSGTAFIANAQIGEGLVAPDNRIYEITGIASDTSLTISPAYLGSTASGQGYAIAPVRGRITQLVAEASSLLSSFAAVRDGIGAGLMADGNVSLPGLRFAADQDTGLARIGTNSLAMVAGGQAQVTTGNGTTSIAGNLTMEGSGTSPNAFEQGFGRSGDGATFHDFHASSGVDFSARITRNPGVNGTLEIINSGAGATFFINAGAGVYQWYISNQVRAELGFTRFVPGPDNTLSLGDTNNRWTTIFAATGTINTSDEREKQWRGPLNAAEMRAAKRLISELGIFQFLDAIAEKGADEARLHFGVKAQQAFEILTDEGLDWTRYAWCCFDEWDATPAVPAVPEVRDPETGKLLQMARPEIPARPAGNRYSIRTDQLAFWLIAAQAEIQSDLEARIAALEAGQ